MGGHPGVIAKPKDPLGDYSLMQHYGAPTRLLDFSKSIYLAAFFAVEDVEHNEDSFIWCINEMIVRDKIIPRESCKVSDGNEKEAQYEEMRKCAEARLSASAHEASGFLILNPREKTERSLRQQGLFLFPLSLTKSIEDTLAEVYGCEKERGNVDVSYYDKVNTDEVALIIRIQSRCRKNILQSLNQMNVNHETLFPGIEGFCRSLYYKLSVL